MEGFDIPNLPSFARNLFNRVLEPDDSQEDRLQKSIMITSTLFVNLNGLFLVLLYFRFHEPLAATSILIVTIISLLSFAYFIVTRKYQLHQTISLYLALLGPFIVTLILGGLANSSAAILFAMIIPTGAVTFNRAREAPYWFAAALALLVLAGVLQPYLRTSNNLPAILIDPILFIFNIGFVAALVFGTVYRLVGERDRAYRLLRQEQEKSERLLLNVLPKEIAPILKEGRTIANYVDSVSILFADIVGSTPLYEMVDAIEMVDWLNEIFSRFDTLVEKYALEKIRNNGDNYMVAAGVPKPRPDHARVIALLALDMNQYLSEIPDRNGNKIQFRMGINCGPVVAGVIGKTKFRYDTWGDTVNVASRMESHGIIGKIQISEPVYILLKDEFVCESRGLIDVKGKGKMKTWFLVGKRERQDDAPF